MMSLNYWKHFLKGAKHPFEIWTDHKNLEYFMKEKTLNDRQIRWSIELADYNFTLHHKPGKTNPADPLSRRSDLEKDLAVPEEQILLGPQYFKARATQIQKHRKMPKESFLTVLRNRTLFDRKVTQALH